MNEESLDNVLNEESSDTLIEDQFLDLQHPHPPAFGPCQCDFNVDYCCVESVPSFYNNNLSTLNDDNRIFYDPTCLTCTVEECTVQIPCSSGGTSPATLFAAVIKGCMPFQAEARFNNPAPCNEPPFPGGRNAAICCRGTVCFDNAVDFGCQEDMEDLCACINGLLSSPSTACKLIDNTRMTPQLVNCSNFAIINPSTNPTAGRCTDRFVRFRGRFTIDGGELQRQCNFQRA